MYPVFWGYKVSAFISALTWSRLMASPMARALPVGSTATQRSTAKTKDNSLPRVFFTLSPPYIWLCLARTIPQEYSTFYGIVNIF